MRRINQTQRKAQTDDRLGARPGPLRTISGQGRDPRGGAAGAAATRASRSHRSIRPRPGIVPGMAPVAPLIIGRPRRARGSPAADLPLRSPGSISVTRSSPPSAGASGAAQREAVKTNRHPIGVGATARPSPRVQGFSLLHPHGTRPPWFYGGSKDLAARGTSRSVSYPTMGLGRHGPIWALIAPAAISLPLSCRIRSCHPP
jgi:hypothetical protein